VVWFICRDLEQVAMDRLVELAYKKQLVTFCVCVCVFIIVSSNLIYLCICYGS
jgi:hypothetical protein